MLENTNKCCGFLSSNLEQRKSNQRSIMPSFNADSLDQQALSSLSYRLTVRRWVFLVVFTISSGLWTLVYFTSEQHSTGSFPVYLISLWAFPDARGCLNLEHELYFQHLRVGCWKAFLQSFSMSSYWLCDSFSTHVACMPRVFNFER